MKTNLKNFIPVCAGLILTVALSVVIVACSSASSTKQSKTTSKTTTASPVTSAPVTAQRRGSNGTLASINGNTLTLTTSQGQVIVNVSSSTTIEKTVSGTASDLTQGYYVTISGTADSTGNINATSVIVQPQGQPVQSFPTTGIMPGSRGGFPRPGGGASGGGMGGQFTTGTINGINGNSFTVMTARGQIIVNLSANTIIQKTINGALSDLNKGDSLSVIGTTDNSGNINAISISIRPQGQGFPVTQSTTTS